MTSVNSVTETLFISQMIHFNCTIRSEEKSGQLFVCEESGEQFECPVLANWRRQSD